MTAGLMSLGERLPTEKTAARGSASLMYYSSFGGVVAAPGLHCQPAVTGRSNGNRDIRTWRSVGSSSSNLKRVALIQRKFLRSNELERLSPVLKLNGLNSQAVDRPPAPRRQAHPYSSDGLRTIRSEQREAVERARCIAHGSLKGPIVLSFYLALPSHWTGFQSKSAFSQAVLQETIMQGSRSSRE